MNKKLIIILAGCIAALGAVSLLLFLGPKKGTDSNTFESVTTHIAAISPAPKPTVNLQLTSPSASVGREDEVVITVSANGEKEILAIDLYINYDKNSLELLEITPGSYFPEPMILANTNDESKGTLTYSLASLTPKNKAGQIAQLTFKAIKPTDNASIVIDPKTLVSVRGGLEGSIQVGTPLKLQVN